jgi:predicted nucleic acid-binding protein
MALVLLDTTVLIDALRGRPAGERIRALGTAGDVPTTSAVNVEEVIRGLRSPETAAARRLFNGIRVLPLGRPHGEQAGAWRREFAERGVTLAQADCLIAAAAAHVGARLATGNPRHFPMPELTVEHWQVGE